MNNLAALVRSLQPNRNEVEQLADQAANLAGRLADELRTASFDREKTARLLRAISGDADYISDQGERAAEQAAMALDSIYIAYAKARGRSGGGARAGIKRLFQQLGT